MPVVKIDMRQYVESTRRMSKEILDAAMDGAYSAAFRSVDVMHRRTREAPPANPAGKGSGGAVNTGAFLQAWKAERTAEGARSFNNKPYAPVVEHGRRAPKKPPPKEAIVRWIQRRLRKTESEARSLAFVIARAIGKRGLKGRKIAEGAEQEIREIAAEEIGRAVKEALEKQP